MGGEASENITFSKLRYAMSSLLSRKKFFCIVSLQYDFKLPHEVQCKKNNLPLFYIYILREFIVVILAILTSMECIITYLGQHLAFL